MNENELREVLGEELFDRLSQEDKELILNTAGKFDFDIWHTRADKPHSSQPFYVVDKELGEVVNHPDNIIAVRGETKNGAVNIIRENTYFGMDCYGNLLILNSFGGWSFAPERYIYIINSDYWS